LTIINSVVELLPELEFLAACALLKLSIRDLFAERRRQTIDGLEMDPGSRVSPKQSLGIILGRQDNSNCTQLSMRPKKSPHTPAPEAMGLQTLGRGGFEKNLKHPGDLNNLQIECLLIFKVC
jgi:hypothetical protein